MALPVSVAPPETDLDAKRKRALLFDALVENLRQLAAGRTLLVLVEDAHWIDPTSRELVELLVSRMSQWPILLVVTSRPEFDPRVGRRAACGEDRVEADQTARCRVPR